MLAFVRKFFARKAAPVNVSTVTVAQWNALSLAEQQAATAAHSAAERAAFDARGRAYAERVAKDNAAYKAAKPARVAAIVAAKIKAGELDAIAARLGWTEADIDRAKRNLSARFGAEVAQ